MVKTATTKQEKLNFVQELNFLLFQNLDNQHSSILITHWARLLFIFCISYVRSSGSDRDLFTLKIQETSVSNFENFDNYEMSRFLICTNLLHYYMLKDKKMLIRSFIDPDPIFTLVRGMCTSYPGGRWSHNT